MVYRSTGLFYDLFTNDDLYYLHTTMILLLTVYYFFFNDTATTEIYTLSLHDALPISDRAAPRKEEPRRRQHVHGGVEIAIDRKSTRLNSSHVEISYAVFCLKKKKRSTTGKRYSKIIRTMCQLISCEWYNPC